MPGLQVKDDGVIDEEDKLRITKGMLKITSYRGGKLLHAIWPADYCAFVVRVRPLGPFRRIGWKQAEKLIETGEIDWIDVDTSVGRAIDKPRGRRRMIHRVLQETRRAEYLAEKL